MQMAPNSTNTPTITSRILTTGLPFDAAGAAPPTATPGAAICGGAAGVPGGACGAPAATPAGPAGAGVCAAASPTRVPHFTQNPCPSPNGEPQFLQNPAIAIPLG